MVRPVWKDHQAQNATAYRAWREEQKKIDQTQPPMVVRDIEKSLEKKYKQRLSRIERRSALNYFEGIIQRMVRCESPHCGHSEYELRLRLSFDISWLNLSSYRSISSTKKIGTFILNALKSHNVPLERKDRPSAEYHLFGMTTCYYCLLAWHAIPEGTARKYLFVFFVFFLIS